MSERGFEQVPLGDSGMSASAVGFGTYHLREKLGAAEAIDAMAAGFQAGITMFDTSDNYGTEELIGLAVKEGSLPRDQVIIATKTGLATSAQEHLAMSEEDRHVDTSPERIRRQVEKSLRLLGENVGAIDIYQLHGHDAPGYDVAQTMNQLMQEGKIRAYGVSNYSEVQLVDLLGACAEQGLSPPTTYQPFANVIAGYDDEAGAQVARDSGMTVLAHSPLHKGMLSEAMVETVYQWLEGARSQEYDSDELDAIEESLGLLQGLNLRALDAGHNLARLGIAWAGMQPNTIVLSSPTSPERLEDTTKGSVWQLDEETSGLVKEAQERFRELNFVNISLNLMRHMKIYYR